MRNMAVLDVCACVRRVERGNHERKICMQVEVKKKKRSVR